MTEVLSLRPIGSHRIDPWSAVEAIALSLAVRNASCFAIVAIPASPPDPVRDSSTKPLRCQGNNSWLLHSSVGSASIVGVKFTVGVW